MEIVAFILIVLLVGIFVIPTEKGGDTNDEYRRG
jgi:hypothetical protein